VLTNGAKYDIIIVPKEREVYKMMKCPNCGSTAQAKVILDKHYAYRNGSERIVVYNCGCGANFCTSQLYMYDKPITQVRQGGIVNATVEEILTW
jgi:hypothetical protein